MRNRNDSNVLIAYPGSSRDSNASDVPLKVIELLRYSLTHTPNRRNASWRHEQPIVKKGRRMRSRRSRPMLSAGFHLHEGIVSQ